MHIYLKFPICLLDIKSRLVDNRDISVVVLCSRHFTPFFLSAALYVIVERGQQVIMQSIKQWRGVLLMQKEDMKLFWVNE